MSGRTSGHAPIWERRYSELRCRRYLFEPLAGEEPRAAGVDPASAETPEAAPAPEGWVSVRRPQ